MPQIYKKGKLKKKLKINQMMKSLFQKEEN